MSTLVKVRKAPCLLAFVVLVVSIVACNQQKSPDELREQAAKQTAQLKQDAKAVAQGVREGWNRDAQVNLNTASKEQLMTLPGLNAAEADRIIGGRPYREPIDLTTKYVISKAEYDKIADRVTTQK